MAWTYDVTKLTDPTLGPLMRVRLLIGDTDTTDQQLQDEEIAYFLSTEANGTMAASKAARSIGSKLARQADKQVGDLKISMSAISQKYVALADELRGRGMTYQIPSAGGIFVAETEANESNGSLRHNAIRRGMHDYVAGPVIPNVEGS